MVLILGPLLKKVRARVSLTITACTCVPFMKWTAALPAPPATDVHARHSVYVAVRLLPLRGEVASLMYRNLVIVSVQK
jgi:hypothetical protein